VPLYAIRQTSDAITGVSDVVDIFNFTAGTWTVAQLCSPRESLAATSLPDQGLALFAGGYGREGTFSFRVFGSASSCPQDFQVGRIAWTFLTRGRACGLFLP
jgi:hypothetical protein